MVLPAGPLQLPAGAATSLQCGAASVPAARLAWRGPGNSSWVGPRLYFSSLAHTDTGQYTCRATNSQGSAVSDPVLLTVTGPPTIQPASTEEGIATTVMPGEAAVLSVRYCGWPAPSLVWRAGRVTLWGGARHGRLSSSRPSPRPAHPGCYTATLHIHHARLQDTGSYNVRGATEYRYFIYFLKCIIT